MRGIGLDELNDQLQFTGTTRTLSVDPTSPEFQQDLYLTGDNFYQQQGETPAAPAPAAPAPVTPVAAAPPPVSVYAQKQWEILAVANPMHDEVHTGIRSASDIRTGQEVFRDLEMSTPDFSTADAQAALKKGTLPVFSSHPIEPGVFVTPSRMEAKTYAGDGKLYHKI